MLAASVLGVGTFAWMIAMVGMWLLVDGCRTAVRAVLWQRKSLSVVGLVFLCVFVEFLRGGFNLEGNMEQPLTEEAELWLAAVEAEQRAIEALPFVKSVTFTYGETANLCKVLGTVWCCWQPSRGSFKQVAVACHLEQRPTHLEALRELHQKLVREHGGATHCADPKAIARRAELQNMDDEHENTASGNAFDRMRAAASMQAVAAQRAAIDARELEQARAAEMKATLAREEAEARAKSSAATAAALAPQKASKKQKVASAQAPPPPPAPSLSRPPAPLPPALLTPAPLTPAPLTPTPLMPRKPRKRKQSLTLRGGRRTPSRYFARYFASSRRRASSQLTQTTRTPPCPHEATTRESAGGGTMPNAGFTHTCSTGPMVLPSASASCSQATPLALRVASPWRAHTKPLVARAHCPHAPRQS